MRHLPVFFHAHVCIRVYALICILVRLCLWPWQREVELASKMKEENKWLRVAYKDALAKAERAMAAAAKEGGRADEVEKALRLRDTELEQLQGRLRSLQDMYNT